MLVKRLAKAMGGDLVSGEQEGRGLDLHADRAGGNGKGFAASAPTRRRICRRPVALRILCAEDNPFGRVVLNAILTELGHRVDFVGTGEAAVNAVRAAVTISC